MSCCTNAPENEFEAKDGSALWTDASPYEVALKEIEWLKECVTVSNNDTKYFRDKLEVALTEVEALHDRLAVVIGQREDLK